VNDDQRLIAVETIAIIIASPLNTSSGAFAVGRKRA
jgi:hypothetical protein